MNPHWPGSPCRCNGYHQCPGTNFGREVEYPVAHLWSCEGIHLLMELGWDLPIDTVLNLRFPTECSILKGTYHLRTSPDFILYEDRPSRVVVAEPWLRWKSFRSTCALVLNVSWKKSHPLNPLCSTSLYDVVWCCHICSLCFVLSRLPSKQGHTTFWNFESKEKDPDLPESRGKLRGHQSLLRRKNFGLEWFRFQTGFVR